MDTETRVPILLDRIARAERENLALRRMFCAYYAGARAYMDDGEATDSSTWPLIDFIRDTPDEIQQKLQQRALKKANAQVHREP